MQTTTDLHSAAQQVAESMPRELVSTGQETGVQVAAYHDGKLVWMLWPAWPIGLAAGR